MIIHHNNFTWFWPFTMGSMICLIWYGQYDTVKNGNGQKVTSVWSHYPFYVPWSMAKKMTKDAASVNLVAFIFQINKCCVRKIRVRIFSQDSRIGVKMCMIIFFSNLSFRFFQYFLFYFMFIFFHVLPKPEESI